MKYICLSYLGPTTWETMSEIERKGSMDEFFAYDEMLRKNGNIVGGRSVRALRRTRQSREQRCPGGAWTPGVKV